MSEAYSSQILPWGVRLPCTVFFPPGLAVNALWHGPIKRVSPACHDGSWSPPLSANAAAHQTRHFLPRPLRTAARDTTGRQPVHWFISWSPTRRSGIPAPFGEHAAPSPSCPSMSKMIRKLLRARTRKKRNRRISIFFWKIFETWGHGGDSFYAIVSVLTGNDWKTFAYRVCAFLVRYFSLCKGSVWTQIGTFCPLHHPTFYHWKIAVLFRQNAFEQNVRILKPLT